LRFALKKQAFARLWGVLQKPGIVSKRMSNGRMV